MKPQESFGPLIKLKVNLAAEAFQRLAGAANTSSASSRRLAKAIKLVVRGDRKMRAALKHDARFARGNRRDRRRFVLPGRRRRAEIA